MYGNRYYNIILRYSSQFYSKVINVTKAFLNPRGQSPKVMRYIKETSTSREGSTEIFRKLFPSTKIETVRALRSFGTGRWFSYMHVRNLRTSHDQKQYIVSNVIRDEKWILKHWDCQIQKKIILKNSSVGLPRRRWSKAWYPACHFDRSLDTSFFWCLLNKRNNE